MSGDNETTERKVENQRQMKERQKQYTILTGLGWKHTGILFLVLIIVIAVYAVFFH